MNENEQKLAFARYLLLTPDNPFEAARKVFKNNIPQVLLVYQEWQDDFVVLDEMERLRAEQGKRKFMDDAEDTAQFSKKLRTAAFDLGELEIAIKANEQYAKIMGFIQKPGTTINANTSITHVMEVDKHGNDNDWEKTLLDQQALLTDESSDPQTRH
jgi:hypothetical protein